MRNMTTILFSLIFSVSMAQTTAIPDSNFEQALIDQNIDSDGVLNGVVLTSDISNISNLDISHEFIQDITGIQDFGSLVNLDVSYTSIETLDLTANPMLKILTCDDVYDLTVLNLSGNPLLEELYCNQAGDDTPTLNLFSLDLSANPNIQIVEARNSDILTTIILSNGNNINMENLYLDLTFDGQGGAVKQMCIQVDDPQAATQNEAPYSTWNIIDTGIDYSFSENCYLSATEFLTENISLFPNPVDEFVFIESPYQLKTAEIYTLNGEKLQNDFSDSKRIDLRSLTSGIYFIKLSDENGNQVVKKIVKK